MNTKTLFVRLVIGKCNMSEFVAKLKDSEPYKLAQSVKIDIDRAMVRALSQRYGIEPKEAEKNGILSKLTFSEGTPRKALHDVRKLLLRPVTHQAAQADPRAALIARLSKLSVRDFNYVIKHAHPAEQ